MSLFWQEIKKIWRPGILTAILVLSGMLYYVQSFDYVERMMNEEYVISFSVLEELFQRCGPAVDRSEWPILQEVIDREKKVFAGYLAENPDAYDLRKMNRPMMAAMKEVAMEKIRICKAEGKSWLK